jgi:lipid-binding SYLF domain-containing protein
MTSQSSALAQKPASEKFKHAIERSDDSARVLSVLLLPDSGFPKELLDRAEIVAVFPHANRQDALVRRVMHGYGVISRRQENGWTLPAFYEFISAPRKFSGTSGKTLAVVLLFLNKDAVSWFGEGKAKFKSDKAARLGPVGAITEEQRNSLDGTQVLAYTYSNGLLNAGNIDPDFFKDFILDQDNNVNRPLYGMKGHEILTGRKVDNASLPAGISAFQEALQKLAGP